MSADTRDRILTTAARLFTEQGYDATSLREISDELGVTKAALYYHFPSKEDILSALVRPFIDLIDQLVARLEAADDIVGWADAIDWIVVQVLDHTPEFTLLQRNRTAIETLARTEAFYADHQQLHERVEKALANAGHSIGERVRMVAALGAVTGFDDWAPTLLIQTDADELRRHLNATVHDILGVGPAPD